MPEVRAIGWLISVQTASPRPLYATVADNHEQAKAQVGDFCAATIVDTIRIERLLTGEEIKQLGLQPGEVKLYGT